MNPFAVLGINEVVLRGIDDEAVVTLVQSAYRTLSRLYHPDRGGNSRVFNQISGAYQSLQDATERRELLMQYLAPKDDKISKLQDDLFEIKENFENFVRQLVKASTEGILPQRHEQLLVAVGPSQFESTKRTNICALNQQGSNLTILPLKMTRRSPAKIPRFAKKVGVNDFGLVTKDHDDFFFEGAWVCWDPAMAGCDNEFEAMVLFEQLPAKKLAGMVLLGSVDKSCLPTSDSVDKDMLALPTGVAGVTRSAAAPQKVLKQGLSFAQIEQVLKGLEFGFEVGNYLIGASINASDQVRFHMIGQLVSYQLI